MTACKYGWVRLAALAVTALMGLLFAGCGAIREASTRDKVIREETANFVYAVPIEKIWPEAKAMFALRGFDIADDTGDRSAGAYLFTTSWKLTRASSSSTSSSMCTSRERFVVRGTKVEGGARVEVTGSTQRSCGSEDYRDSFPSRRDPYRELDLIKRV